MRTGAYGQGSRREKEPPMKSSHAVLLSCLLAVAAVAATLAVLKTTSLGMQAKPAAAAVSAEQLAARNAELD